MNDIITATSNLYFMVDDILSYVSGERVVWKHTQCVH